MLRVDIDHARPGLELALPVRHPQAMRRILLKVGFSLTPEMIKRLKELRVRSLWVRYPSLTFLTDIINPKLIESQGEVVNQIAATFSKVQTQAVARLPFDTYTQTIAQLVDGLVSNPQAAVFLGDLAQGGGGQDLMRHSSTVTYLCLLMGLKLEGYLVKQRRRIDPGRAKGVINLGLGAMLHDIGVSQLPKEVRERYENTGNESDPEWQEHPALGYEMLRGKIAPSAATAVLNHHQRVDGTGYAGKGKAILDGKQIHVFPRIVAVADQFDRMRNPVGLPAQPTAWVLSAFLDPRFLAKFDPEVVRALLTVVPPYPPGSMLRLSDGRWAVAIDHVPVDPCRPVVQIMPDPKHLNTADDAEPGIIINLHEERPDLSVTQSEGADVTSLNFAAPVLMQEDLVVSTW